MLLTRRRKATQMQMAMMTATMMILTCRGWALDNYDICPFQGDDKDDGDGGDDVGNNDDLDRLLAIRLSVEGLSNVSLRRSIAHRLLQQLSPRLALPCTCTLIMIWLSWFLCHAPAGCFGGFKCDFWKQEICVKIHKEIDFKLKKMLASSRRRGSKPYFPSDFRQINEN